MVSKTSSIPKLSLVVTPQVSETDEAIKQLSRLRTWSNGAAIDKAVVALRAQEKTKPAPVETVTIENIPKATASRLYALLGRVRKQDGFADLFHAFAGANFPLDREPIHLSFVGDQILRIETPSEYKSRNSFRGGY